MLTCLLSLTYIYLLLPSFHKTPKTKTHTHDAKTQLKMITFPCLGRATSANLIFTNKYQRNGCFEMSGKEVVRRTTTIALGILCIILLIGTVGVVIFYSNVVNDKNATYNDYVLSHIHANSDFDSLNSDYNALQSSLFSLNSTYNSLSSTYEIYKATHSHTDSDYSSVASQLVSANTQIGNLQSWLDGNITTLAQTVNQLKPEQMIFSHSDYVTVNQSMPVLRVFTDADNASKFTISYIVSSLQSPDTWVISGSIGKSGVATNTRAVAIATVADINVLHTVMFVGIAAQIELYGESGVDASIFYSITVEAPAGTTATVIYGL